ncbi:MAG: hypothetical protein IT361_05350 [Gemmatimonadaceae bacterium]|nr:hypothetical protein [Gemmatimonadaceae bacterium]
MDRQGRMYFSGTPRTSSDADGIDSVPLLRLARGSGKLDTVATLGVPVRVAGAPPGAFPATDAWAVGENGDVFVARAGSARVDVNPRGATVSLALPARRVPVAEWHRQLWLSWKNATPQMIMGIDAQGTRKVFAASARRTLRTDKDYRWPKFLPPFVGDAPLVAAPSGEVWVQVAPQNEKNPVEYAILSSRASPYSRARFPAGTRLLGFGARGLYAARATADGLQQLLYYDYPSRD